MTITNSIQTDRVFEEDHEKSNKQYWKKEIKKWKKNPSTNWPSIDYESEIDSTVSTIVIDFVEYIKKTINSGKYASLDGMSFSQEFIWRFSPEYFTDEAFTNGTHHNRSELNDLQYPEEMPATIFEKLCSKQKRAIADIYLSTVHKKLFELWDSESESLPKDSQYTLTVKNKGRGRWSKRRVKAKNAMQNIFAKCLASADSEYIHPGKVDGYYQATLSVSVSKVTM